MPRVPAVLVHPGAALATGDVFAALRQQAGTSRPAGSLADLPLEVPALIAALSRYGNDLEAPAIRLMPAIADVLAALREQQECGLARMSGSGSACFGLFPTRAAAVAAAKVLDREHRGWWIKVTAIGGVV